MNYAKVFSTVLLVLLSSAAALANSIEIKTVDSVETAFYQGQKLGEVTTFPVGSLFFHWGPWKDIERWNSAGQVSDSELDFLRKGEGMAGGGFYVSMHSTDSKDFGSGLITIELKEPIRVLNTTDAGSALQIESLSKIVFENGLDGIWYQGYWLNFLSRKSVSHLRKPKFEDLMASLIGGQRTLLDWMALDLTVGLKPDPRIDHPVVEALLAGRPLSPELRSSVMMELGFARQAYFYLGRHLPASRALNLKERNLFTSLRREMKPDLEKHLAEIFKDLNLSKLDSIPFQEVDFDQWQRVTEALGWGIDVSPWLPGHSLPATTQALSPLNHDSVLDNAFGNDLVRAFEFIDLQDLLVEIAKGSSAPWARYDEPGKRPFLDRWKDATKFINGDETLPKLMNVHRILADEPAADIRGEPIVAGGDYWVNGKGYYRITRHQLSVIEKNPLLKVEWLEDSGSSDTVLARHEYPSASTYGQFKEYLPATLVIELDRASASGRLSDPQSAESKRLTRKVLRALLNQKRNLDPTTRYQWLISVHPFEDYNGRTMRAFYQALLRPLHPLFLRNFDLDLFSGPVEFQVQVEKGFEHFNWIWKNLAEKEIENPRYPDFYRAVAPWIIGLDDGEGKLIRTSDGVNRAMEHYRKPEVVEKIRQKMHYEVGTLNRTFCSSLLDSPSSD